MSFLTEDTPSILFTTASASDFRTGRVTWPSNVTLSLSMRKARLSNTEYHGSMTNSWRTCLANLSRYFSSLRWCLFSCAGRASARGAAATGETNNSDTNRARSCFFMVTLLVHSVPDYQQLDSRCRTEGCMKKTLCEC